MGWRRVPLFLIVLVLSLLAAACSGNSDSSSTTTTVPDQPSTTSTDAPPTTSPQPSTSTTEADGGEQAGSSPRIGTGNYTLGTETTFKDAPVYRCEPVTDATGGPHPDNISLWAYPDETKNNALHVELLHDVAAGDNEDGPMLVLNVYASLDLGNGEVARWEGHASNDAEGNWFLDDQQPVSDPPKVLDNRLNGSLLIEPVEGPPDAPAEAAYVFFNLEIPTEITPDCGG